MIWSMTVIIITHVHFSDPVLPLINRTGGLYGRILIKVMSTDRLDSVTTMFIILQTITFKLF